MPGLGTTFGRGGATTAPSDLVNSDVVLIMGSNMAENHPVGFQWMIEAKEKHGTHVIHVDPRFSRTSAVANTWVPLRAGSDILFLGGLINHILQNELDFREYVVHYTNASVIIPETFKDTEELGGIFFLQAHSAGPRVEARRVKTNKPIPSRGLVRITQFTEQRLGSCVHRRSHQQPCGT